MALTAPALLAAALAAVAVLVAWPRPGHGRIRAAPGSRAAPAHRAGFRPGARVERPRPGWAWHLARSRARERRRADDMRDLVAELCRATAAELRVGRPPDDALRAALSLLVPVVPAGHAGQVGTAPRRVAGVVGTPATALWPVLRAAAGGGDVEDALRRASRAPGGAALAGLAVCWRVASGTGAGLAGAVDRIADGLAADDAIRREVAAQLAAPRATARLLTGVPVVGVVMGHGLGVDVVGMLLGTPLGGTCLVAGTALLLVGWWWTIRLIRDVEPP